jgi:hypothetical protein
MTATACPASSTTGAADRRLPSAASIAVVEQLLDLVHGVVDVETDDAAADRVDEDGPGRDV